MPTGPGVVPPSNPPPSFPDDYANLSAVNGNNVILTNETSVDISGMSDGVGASIVTYLVPYADAGGKPESGNSIISESNTVTVKDAGYKDADNNEVGTYSAVLRTTGLAPGIYVAESFLEFPNGGNTVFEDSGADSRQVVTVEAPSTQSLPAQIQLSGTNAEISTDGKYLVYTAINEYNEPETTGDVYERNLQTGAEVDLTATGQAPTGVFAVNHTASISGEYPTFTSANGTETFSTINDFDINPDTGGYNPLPVVTNAAGVQSVIGGIGSQKYFVGAATAVSDDGSVVLSTETNQVRYFPTGSSTGVEPDPQIYVTFLGPQTAAGPDIFEGGHPVTSGPLEGSNLWSNALNWSDGVPANGSDVTIAALDGLDDIPTLSLNVLDVGEDGQEIDNGSLTIGTLIIGNDAAFQAGNPFKNVSVTVDIGTVEGTNAFLDADGVGATLVVSNAAQLKDEFQLYAGGKMVLDNLQAGEVEFEDGGGTLALTAPSSTIAGGLSEIAAGDVLELPGDLISGIDFGNQALSETTMRVTTSSGIYVFNDVSYEDVHSYSFTAGDSGMVAITFGSAVGPDVFSDTTASSSGQFLWSNNGNWSNKIPGANSAASLAGNGIDDLSLSLTTLISTGAVTTVDGPALDVSTLVVDSAAGLVANSALTGGSATVSVLLGTVSGSGALFVADGANASIEILDGGLPAEVYQAEAGGRIILDNLSAGSAFGFVGVSTLALALPGASTSATIAGFGVGDVLELPGTVVSGVSFGTNALGVTTDSGTYNFTNVDLGAGVGAYTSSVDPATGLVALTLVAAPRFQEKSEYTGAEPLNGVYFWSDSGNWVAGAVPVTGDDVIEDTSNGIDDINDLSLSGLTLGSGDQLALVGEHLTLANVFNQGVLTAQGGAVAPDETIVINGVTEPSGDSGLYFADGQGAVIVDNVAINTGELIADAGGMVEVNAAPGAAALNYDGELFDYYNGPASIALSHPGATINTALMNVEREDVLELPGSKVSAVHFGTASLTITTSAGTYDFTNVSYEGSVTGYTSSVDAATGLEAITFTGAPSPTVDVFNGSVDHGDFLTLSGELWSTDDNWLNKVPRSGDSIEISFTGFSHIDGQSYIDPGVDDIAGLTLASMQVDAANDLLVYDALTVGTMDIAGTGIVGAQGALTVTGNTENDGVINAYETTTVLGGALTGSGTLGLSGGNAAIHGSIAATQTLDFDFDNEGGNGRLELFNPGSVIGAAIMDFGPGSVLELPGSKILELPGSKIIDVSFGANDFAVTTSSGIFDFTNVTFSGSVGAYSASLDAATGLEAITFSVPDVLTDKSSGPHGEFLWSNAANWSAGVPGNGAAIDTSATTTDDIANLTLSSLNLSTPVNGSTDTELQVSSGLSISSLTISDQALLIAQGSGAANVVTVGQISVVAGGGGADPTLYAMGAGAVINDQGSAEPAVEYIAQSGGRVELAGAPNAGAALTYGDGGTFALAAPGATVNALLNDVGVGDVLELPATKIDSIVFGASSLTITTDKGVFDFKDVTFENKVDGFTTALDPVTGLEAITFTGPDVFSENKADGSGHYLWSNAANWSAGIPGNGSEVTLAATGNDDIAGLSLSSLAVTTPVGVGSDTELVVAAGLSIASLTISDEALLIAEGTGAADVVTVGKISVVAGGGGATPTLYAMGAGAVIDDTGKAEAAVEYIAQNGGRVELAGAPNAASVLTYGDGGTFALAAPGATISAELNEVGTGDVLELAVGKVDGIVFGASSLTITTDKGVFDFKDVTFENKVDGFTAALDSTTGLEAIAFIGPDIFSEHTANGSGQYLWSNAANWSAGVPGNGGEVTLSATGNDDIAGLSLSSLAITTPVGIGTDTELVVASGLSVASLTISDEALLIAEGTGEADVVTVGKVSIVAGGGGATPTLYAMGAGAVIDDTGTSEPAVEYIAQNGGRVALAAAPNADSVLTYGDGGTFALAASGATISALLNEVGAGDVLELSATKIDGIVFGASSLTISTDKGVFDFKDVTFENKVDGFTSTLDSATGLEAITFIGPDIFSEHTANGSGQYLWSNAANWSAGVPGAGGEVTMTASGNDDIDGLSLSSLAVATPLGGNLDTELVVASGLSVASLTISDEALVIAEATGEADVVTVGKISVVAGGGGATPTLYAMGAGAVIDDTGKAEPAVEYIAQSGGRVELAGAPNAGTALTYGGDGTFALAAPGATITALLNDVSAGDVLELPGTSIDNVIFGASSLTIVTGGGDFIFSNVSYAASVSGYFVFEDAATGLQAINFGVANSFSDAASGGLHAWSVAGNWSQGAPPTGGSVSISSSTQNIDSDDDIANLTLSSLTLETAGNANQGQLTVDAGLSVAALTLSSNHESISVTSAGGADTLTIGGITTNSPLDPNVLPSALGAGAGGVIIVKGASDPALSYGVINGGFIELENAVNAGSDFNYANDIFGDIGTFALSDPGAVIAAEVSNIQPGDVLELPGAKVDNVVFGNGNLTITTDKGSFDFTSVNYFNPVTGFSASHDAKTGLEAITFTGPDIFFDDATDASGDFLWSNAKNWSQGVPVNGVSVEIESNTQSIKSVDDLANLTLSSLTLATSLETTEGQLTVAAGLSVAALTLSSNRESISVASTGGADTLTIGAITTNSPLDPNVLPSALGAGAGGVIIDKGANDPALSYGVINGGFIELEGAVNAGSDFNYANDIFGDVGTFALSNPGAVIAAEVSNIQPGDVLELPGAKIENVVFGNGNLTITTDKGSFDFTSVNYFNPVTGFSASHDAKTGLEAITFTGPDIFFDDATDASGDFLWSNAKNWSQGVPVNGVSVEIESNTQSIKSVDDVANLTLSSLTLATSLDTTEGQLTVAAGLSVAALTLSSNRESISVASTGGADTLTIGAITTNSPLDPNVLPSALGAGAGGVIIDKGANDSALSYGVINGGFIELEGAVNAGSDFNYANDIFGDIGTFALSNPGAVIAAEVSNIQPGDVLELPGAKVENVMFGNGNLTITTDKGSFDFTSVNYFNPVTSFSASHDAKTGLEAISFSGPDMSDSFADKISTGGSFLWSNAGNWSEGVPADGASVDMAVNGTDDIATLSLNDLNVTAGKLAVTGTLDLGSLSVSAGAEVDDLKSLVVTGETFDDGVISTDPSMLTFNKAVTGSGTIDIGAGSDVIFDSAVAASETIDFVSNTGTLTINDPSGFAGKVVGSGTTIVNGVTVTAADASPSLTATGGVLTAGAADEFTLNLGSVTQGGAALTATLDLANIAVAPADALGGSFAISGTSFGNTGFGNLTGIAAGATADAGSITLQTGSVGTFSETILLTPVETRSDGSVVALAKETVNVTGVITPPTGSAQGDVHLVTFDGLHYNFQATGDFVLARSTVPGDSFQVQMQAMQYRQIAGTSVADEYAAQLGNDRIAFTAGANGAIGVTVNGVADTAINAAGARQIFAGGTLVADAANNFTLDWNTGESMHVTSEIPLGQTYLDASVSLPVQDGPGSVQGLMGSNSGQANDFALADGTILFNPSSSELLGEFADSWRVTSATSILGDVAPVTASSVVMPFSAMLFASAAKPQAVAAINILTGSLGSSHFGQVASGGGADLGSAMAANAGISGKTALHGAAYGLDAAPPPQTGLLAALHATSHAGLFLLG